MATQGRKKWAWALAIFAAGGAGLGNAVAIAQSNGAYTETQSAAGQDAFSQNCASCHMNNLGGDGEAPALAGMAFMGSWGNRSTRDLFSEIKLAMPLTNPNSLGDETYASIVAYILKANGAQAGTVPFTPDASVTIHSIATGKVPAEIADAKPGIATAAAPGARANSRGGRRVPTAPPTGLTVTGTVKNYTPVTDEMMTNPSDSDWLMHYHNYAGWSFSPLSQINSQNVRTLQLRWVWPMDEGGYQQITPLVHDGVMFLSNNLTNKVQALDAKTGDLIWENSIGPVLNDVLNATRTMALYGDKLIYPATDGKLYALDAKSGKIDWRIDTTSHGRGRIGSVMAVHGKVIIGSKQCVAGSIEDQCFIAAYDVNTGKQIWKFLTVAGTGAAGGDSWLGLPDDKRTGNGQWNAGTYDPKLNLVFFGTGQAKVRGINGDALFSLSTLALDADTGKLIWYFQAAPDDGLDLDEAFEKTLIDEGDQKIVITTGKKGIMWKLDRVTGKYLNYRETVFQNLFTSINPKTGRSTYRPDILAQTAGSQIVSCPSAEGGHNWPTTSYDPDHDLIILPLSQTCTIGGNLYEMPGTEGNLGRVSAYKVKTFKPVWSFQQRSPFLTGVMTTGGDLGIVGDWNRVVRAFNVRTGETLWQTRLGTTPQGYITTYSVDGEQFIAIPTGYNGGSPEKKPTTMLGGSLNRPTTGQAVYVFALPKAQ